jgi:hypothetical protein
MAEAPNQHRLYPTSISYVNEVFYPVGGWNFKILGIWLSLSDVKQSWLRLQTNTYCILLPNHLCNFIFKVVPHLAMLWMGRGSPLTLFYVCAGGGGFLETWGMVEPE